MATEKIIPASVGDRVRVKGEAPVGTVTVVNGATATVAYEHKSNSAEHADAKDARKIITQGFHELETLEVVQRAKVEKAK
jgi:hypothetical protein